MDEGESTDLTVRGDGNSPATLPFSPASLSPDARTQISAVLTENKYSAVSAGYAQTPDRASAPPSSSSSSSSSSSTTSSTTMAAAANISPISDVSLSTITTSPSTTKTTTTHEASTTDIPMDNCISDNNVNSQDDMYHSSRPAMTPYRPRANTVSATTGNKRRTDASSDAPAARPRANTFSSGSGCATTSSAFEAVSKINLRSRINRHPVQEKVRHKRQTLQDMARPLKHWLYKNRDNPYPTKPEKISLALGSEMTLVQVSNWFANARRRLKNTVKDTNMSWSRRIKKYNSNVQGNAELLSISSDDSMWESSDEADEDAGQSEDTTVGSLDACMKSESEENLHLDSRSANNNFNSAESNNFNKCDSQSEDMGGPLFFSSNEDEFINTSTRSRNSSGYCSEDQSQPQKYKQTMLHRYLHDAYENVCTHANVESDTSMRMRYRCPSGSVSSHDFEDIASSRSTPTKEHYILEDCHEVEEFLKQRQNASNSEEESLYYKELSAAMALTTLARNKFSKVNVTSHK